MNEQDIKNGFIKRAAEFGFTNSEAERLYKVAFFDPAAISNWLTDKGISPQMAGAGIGAIGGGLLGAATGGKNKLRNGLLGALGGGALGYGGGSLFDHFNPKPSGAAKVFGEEEKSLGLDGPAQPTPKPAQAPTSWRYSLSPSSPNVPDHNRHDPNSYPGIDPTKDIMFPGGDTYPGAHEIHNRNNAGRDYVDPYYPGGAPNAKK